jgi:hypothetical protein
MFFPQLLAAKTKTDFEAQVINNWAQKLSQINSPTEALDKTSSRLKKTEVEYLKTLIAKKLWLEVPSYSVDKNFLVMTFSNKRELRLEVVDYWGGQYQVNGHKLDFRNYQKIDEKVNYLKRIVKNYKDDTKINKNSWFNLIVSPAEASLSCNALIDSGCLEVSMASSLWFARTLAEDSPLHTCVTFNYGDENSPLRQKCLADYGNNPTIKTINEFSEILAMTPETSIDISCRESNGPLIKINSTEVAQLGPGRNSEDYSISLEQDKNYRLTKLAGLAIRCCEKNDSDPLNGQCEKFVASYLGSKDKRNDEFKNPNLRLQGKNIQGTR